MKKIIALAGSTSKKSINKQFAYYVANQLSGADVLKLDLNDFSMPMYSVDLENEKGIPKEAINLAKLFRNADGIILSLAEHNGNFTAAFKNVFDWISREDVKVFESSPLLLLSSSPGERGGASVMNIALDRFPRHGATISAYFSLPSFYDNFKDGSLISDDLSSILNQKIDLFMKSL
ncbi:MAG: NAD(P)H-dependent oxidoreductase [Flavobacteriales bacterium]